MYLLRAHEKSNEAVKRIIKEEIDDSIALLTDPDGDRESAVHEARKSIKRIRAALRLVRNEIGEEIFDRENLAYRDAARRLAPLRDSVAKLETLDRVHAHFDTSLAADAFETVGQILVEEKKATRKEFLQQEDVIPEVVEELAKGRQRADELPVRHQDFQAFEGGLKKVYRRGRRRMNRSYQDGDSPEKFHDWRKRVKYLWHHIEILQPLWPPVFEVTAEEIHQLSDYLGDAHDAAVLAAHLRENESNFAEEPELPLLLSILTQRRRALETAAEPLGRRIYAEEPNSFVKRLSVYWDALQT